MEKAQKQLASNPESEDLKAKVEKSDVAHEESRVVMVAALDEHTAMLNSEPYKAARALIDASKKRYAVCIACMPFRSSPLKSSLSLPPRPLCPDHVFGLVVRDICWHRGLACGRFAGEISAEIFMQLVSGGATLRDAPFSSLPHAPNARTNIPTNP